MKTIVAGVNRKHISISAFALLLAAHVSSAAVPETQANPPWTPILDTAFPQITSTGAKLKAPSKGVIDGIAVDRTTGDVYALLNKHGLWKSTDHAATFQEPTSLVTGRVMYSFSFNMDPAGKRLACFLEYGTGGITTDAGKTWTPFKVDPFLPKVFDVGAVDWESTAGNTMLVIVHEAKGKLVLTTDAGATWTDLGTGFNQRGPFGVFDDKTLIAAKSNKELQRSTDAGKTWTKVADLPAKAGQIIYVSQGIGYLLTEKGLFVTKDKGATWAVQNSAVKATIGPFFGKDDNHFAAIGDDGAYETTDAGKTWKLVAPLAPDIGPRDYSYAWDPLHDIFYVAQANKPAMKCMILPATISGK